MRSRRRHSTNSRGRQRRACDSRKAEACWQAPRVGEKMSSKTWFRRMLVFDSVWLRWFAEVFVQFLKAPTIIIYQNISLEQVKVVPELIYTQVPAIVLLVFTLPKPQFGRQKRPATSQKSGGCFRLQTSGLPKNPPFLLDLKSTSWRYPNCYLIPSLDLRWPCGEGFLFWGGGELGRGWLGLKFWAENHGAFSLESPGECLESLGFVGILVAFFVWLGF